MTAQNDSELVSHGPCDKCGSSDARATYTDGHDYCFSCGTYFPGDGEAKDATPERKGAPRISGLIPNDELDYTAITKRKITEETCRRYGYAVAKLKSGPVHVAVYRDDAGNVVAHKLRTRDKSFPWKGEAKQATLYGAHTVRSDGRRIVITEGEIDCLTVAQLGSKWFNVVSLPNGAQGAKKSIAKALDWLNKFDSVLLCFDMDEPGRAAINEVAPLFPPGKVKVVSLPRKDANEMLLNDQAGDLVECLWNARDWRPDGVKALGDLREDILKSPAAGLPWFNPTLTGYTFGRRMGEAVALGAGTGIGKTDFIMQQVAFDVTELHEKVGLFFLEQQPIETGKRLAGKYAKKRFHIPDAGWTTDELGSALDTLDANKAIFFYDHFGACDWETIRNTIRVLAKSEGVRLFYLDHLTALAAGEGEREALETIMAEIGGLVKELDVWLLFISHLATPEGKSHEEGGRVTIRHFKGSRSIGFWSHFMFGLERNQQGDDEDERHTTTLRVLKDRYTGLSTGKTIDFGYDATTGLLFEKDSPDEPDDEDTPF